MQESEAKNHAILAAIPDLMVRMSADGVYLDCSKSTKKVQSFIPDEIDPIGRHISELAPSEIVQRQLKAARNALATGQLQIYEQEVEFAGVVQHEEVRVNAKKYLQ